MRERLIKDIERDFLKPSFDYLVKNGLENTSVRDLCKEMQISYGSLYYWFEDKNDFYIDVVKYGTGKVADKLFAVAFKGIKNPTEFFATFLDEVDKYREELQLIFQFATSPDYGPEIRKKAEDFKPTYANYIEELSDILGINTEKIGPTIYLLISILVDYVVWEDRESSQMQLEFLRDSLMCGKTER